MTDLTPASRTLLLSLLAQGAEDGFYEDAQSTYLMRGDLTTAERGNLLDLKLKGLVSTCEHNRGAYWVVFSDAAMELTDAGRQWLAHYRGAA